MSCPACEHLAYTGGHELYLADDIPARLRYWRCGLCDTLWQETEHHVVPVDDETADRELPGWRPRADVIVRGPMGRVLDLWRAGDLDGDAVLLALPRHEVWLGPDGSVFSTPAPGRVAVDGMTAVRTMAGLVIDPAAPYVADPREWQRLQWMVASAVDPRDDARRRGAVTAVRLLGVPFREVERDARELPEVSAHLYGRVVVGRDGSVLLGATADDAVRDFAAGERTA